jgi:prophage regulatory protein
MRYLTYKDLRARGITFSRQHLSRLWMAGRFPRPVKLGVGEKARNFWVEAEITAFIEQRLRARSAPAARRRAGRRGQCCSFAP